MDDLFKKKNYRLPEKLIKGMEADAKQRGFPSENAYVIKALQHFLDCAGVEKLPQMKWIIFKYPAKCAKCDRDIERFEYGLYGRSPEGGIAICGDCAITSIGDKTLLAKHLRLRELKRLEKVLKDTIEEMSQELDIFTVADKVAKLHENGTMMQDLFMKFLTSGIASKDEKEQLEEIMKSKDRLEKVLKDIEEFLRYQLPFLKRKKKRRRQRQEIV